MLISETAKVKIGYYSDYYRALGYDIPLKESSNKKLKEKHEIYIIDKSKEVDVKVADLPFNSNAIVEVSCDICGEVFKRKWANYNKSMLNHGIVVCKRHREILRRETSIRRYGTNSPSQSEEVKQKTKQTNQKRYGVDYYMQTQDFKEKSILTSIDRYGTEFASQAPEVCEKRKLTNINKYGAPYLLNVPEIRNKIKENNLKKYGTENPASSPSVREKIVNSFYFNSSIKTSKPQRYINYLYGLFYDTRLNYPIKYYSGDIVDMDNKIDIEINFGGHFIPVYSGRETIGELQERERRRGCCIIDNGYKIMRIISRHDYLPSDEVLIDMYILAMDFFNEGWNWIDFDIDNKVYIYAGRMDGVAYSYGQLRRIKKGESKEDIHFVFI